MSLRRIEIKESIFHPILATSVINFVLMLVILIMSTTIFAKPSGIEMDFSSMAEGGNPLAGSVVIMVTSENVIYINGRVVTLNELRRFLAQGNFRRDALMIKADPKASMGRVADILDLCRGISGASVNVSTII